MSVSIFASSDEMLHPHGLTRLLGKPILRVERFAFDVPHMSGNRLERIKAWEGEKLHSLVLKRFEQARDWVMRLTHDSHVREVALYTHGIYARLPDCLFVPIIAVARDGDAWSSLMVDISDALPPAAVPVVSETDAQTWLGHLARLHLNFWNDLGLTDVELGLSSLYDFVTILSPARVSGEIQAGRTNPVMEMAARGWEKFYEVAPRDIQDKIYLLQHDPSSLLDQFARMPQTLVHGDYKLPNLGIYHNKPKSSRSVVLDWQDAARGPGVLDLGYFLALNGARLPFSQERAIQIYRDSLSAGGHTVSVQEIERGLLAGGALRLLWLMVTNAQTDMEWWYAVIRRAVP